jgi:hypothetical protein
MSDTDPVNLNDRPGGRAVIQADDCGAGRLNLRWMPRARASCQATRLAVGRQSPPLQVVAG